MITDGRKRVLWYAVIFTLLAFVLVLAVYFAFGGGEYSVEGFINKLMNNNQNDPFVLVSDSAVEVDVFADNITGFDIGDDVAEQVENFFILRYKQLGELQAANFSQIYTRDSRDIPFDEAVHDFMIEERRRSSVALTFPKCTVLLHYNSVAYAGTTIVEVSLTERFSTHFDGLGGVESVQHGIEHFFVLKKEKGFWKVDTHIERSRFVDYANEMAENLLAPQGLGRENIGRSYLEQRIPDFLERLRGNRYSYEADEPMTATYAYDRQLATEYAYSWTNYDIILRNVKDFGDFGDDSVNFTSQCLYAGGIPMDTQGLWGEYWKYYDKTPDATNTKSGYSDSWVDGGDFYQYIEKNSGFGLVAGVCSIDDAESGDIIQFALPKDDDNKVYYQCMVVGNVNDELLLCGQDDDILNFPLSAMGLNFTRAIKIYGYNAIDISW